MNHNPTFASNLVRARKQRSLTQEALSQLSDLSLSMIEAFERGRHEPRLTSILKLECALEMKPGELLSGLKFTVPKR